MLEKNKDPFPKTLSDACQILVGWPNAYGNSQKLMEANDEIAFAMTGITDDAKTKKSNTLHVSSARKTDITQTYALKMMRQETRTDGVF